MNRASTPQQYSIAMETAKSMTMKMESVTNWKTTSSTSAVKAPSGIPQADNALHCSMTALTI